MMNTVYVLIMLVGVYGRGITHIQQEFSSYEDCEVARKWVEKSVQKSSFSVLAQGCFKK